MARDVRVKSVLPKLLDETQTGRLNPDIVLTHRLPLLEAARGYRIFNDMIKDCREMVL